MRGGLMRRWTGTQSRLSCRRRRAALSREKGTKGFPGPCCFRLPPTYIWPLHTCLVHMDADGIFFFVTCRWQRAAAAESGSECKAWS
jgi:hypothetical protein